MKTRFIQFYRFPAALLLLGSFAVGCIIREKVLRQPLHPFAEQHKKELIAKIPIVAAGFWAFIILNWVLKFVFL